MANGGVSNRCLRRVVSGAVADPLRMIVEGGMPALTTQHGRHRITRDRWVPAGFSAGRCLLGVGLAAVLLWLSSGVAVAQPTPVDTPDAEQANALFKELLKEPTNVDLNFRYAEAAV